MGHLEISGSFIITIGHGAGPETLVEVCASHDDGTPYDLLSAKGDQVRFFVALSAMFGSYRIDLDVVDVDHQDAGYAAYQVKVPNDLGVTLDKIRPSTIAIIISDGTDRGQNIACGCAGAEVSSWFGDEVRRAG
jgi:hypothetical protein